MLVRQIHSFKYYNKTFRAGDLTVEDYIHFLKDPIYALEKVLTEFNKEIPAMNEKHLRAFQDILFNKKPELTDILEKKKSADAKRLAKQNEKTALDIHIRVGMICRCIPGITFDSLMKMSITGYNDLINDLAIIMGQEKYNPNRVRKDSVEYTKPDKKGFKQVASGASNMQYLSKPTQ